jgi:hypothetical protein
MVLLHTARYFSDRAAATTSASREDYFVYRTRFPGHKFVMRRA